MPEKTVASAARLCYSNAKDIDTLLTSLSEEKVISFLEKMKELPAHGTVWEHVYFTFGIEGVSRALSHQFVRHRIASFDQQSQRYCTSEDFEYVIPPSIQKNDALRIEFKGICGEINKFFMKAVKQKIPNEDARYLLPNATCTRLICTMNIRSLFHFFALRRCLRAQWEIRLMADEMFKLCNKVSPLIFEKAGAACDQLGYCPEGHMSCGKKLTLAELINKANDN